MADRRIVTVGIGGGGCAIVGRLAALAGGAAPTIACDTDACSLAASEATVRLQIGDELTDGFGAGGDDERGRLAMEAGAARLIEAIGAADLAIVIASLGGGVGSGGAPAFLAAAREAGLPTVCFVTQPFSFEGGQRKSVAARALERLAGSAEVVICVPNDSLFAEAPRADVKSAFAGADCILGGAVLALWQMLARPGYIRLDFGDLRALVEDSEGVCAFGLGEGIGEHKALDAAQRLLGGPLLHGGNTLARAKLLLLSIVGGPDLTLKDVGTIMESVSAAVRPECRVTMGTALDDAWIGRVTLMAVVGERRARKPPVEVAPAQPEPAGAGAPVLERAAAERRERRRPSGRQPALPLETSGRGRFRDSEPTLLNGEDLDVPTFVRRALRIER
jgi:cell division protein FtsZ